jgi:hypothetical protein
MAAYATAAQLAAYLGAPAPTDAARLLLRASEVLDDVVRAPFTVDSQTTLPTDTGIAAALANACCAQVEFWQEVGEANDVDGLAGQQIELTGSTGFTGKRAPVVAPRAVRYLKEAGLMGMGAQTKFDTFWKDDD